MKTKFFTSALIFLFSFFISHAQSPNWLWAAGATGASNDVGYAIATDAGGNVFVTGYFSTPSLSFGATTLTMAGQQDIFTVKYNSSGNALWAKSAGGISYDDGTAIATDANGNVFVAGYFQSASVVFGSTTLNNPGATTSSDIFIVKYDNNGNALWAKSAGGSASELVRSIATDASGSVFITGTSTSPSLTFGTTTLNNGGSYDVFIVKYDSNGNVVWAKGAGGTGMDEGRCITTDAGGNVFVTGQFASPTITFGTTTLTNTNITFDLFTVKYDNSGNIIWAKRAGGTAAENVYGIASDAGGNVYATGIYLNGSFPFGSTTLPSASGYDIFTIKYDSSGNPLWAKRAGNTGVDASRGMGTDASGNVFVTGIFQSSSLTFGSTTLTNAGTTCPGGCDDIFVVKYDSAGNVLWAKSAGGTDYDSDNGMCTDATGNVFITGGFTSPSLAFGSTTLTNPNPSNYDIFVAKLSGVVGIEENSFTQTLHIYPNPFSSEAVLQSDNVLRNASLTVENSLGMTVREIKNINGNTIVLQRSNLRSGIYFIRLTQEHKMIATEKLLITD